MAGPLDGTIFPGDWHPERLARHERLLKLWRGLSTEELLADLMILAQLASYTQHQELQAGRAAGAAECVCRTPSCSHLASEHINGNCVVCGQRGCWT
jgi:hypothetical protein